MIAQDVATQQKGKTKEGFARDKKGHFTQLKCTRGVLEGPSDPRTYLNGNFLLFVYSYINENVGHTKRSE